MLFKSKYKELWENQNSEIDRMTVRHTYEIKRKNKEIDMLKERTIDLKKIIDKNEEIFETYKNEQKKNYLILEKKYTSALEILQKTKDKRRKLASAKGGFTRKINDLTKENVKLESENKELKTLLQKVIKESGRKLTPPTLQELKNYNLFGNRKGLKK